MKFQDKERKSAGKLNKTVEATCALKQIVDELNTLETSPDTKQKEFFCSKINALLIKINSALQEIRYGLLF